jgi:diguanylate cyclase (GGDEF)-like protein
MDKNAKYNTPFSLRRKLIYSHLTVALFCFIVLLAAIFLNIWLGEQSKSLTVVANPAQQIDLQKLNKSIKHSSALLVENIAMPANVSVKEWDSIWTNEIWSSSSGLVTDSSLFSENERRLIKELKRNLVTLQTRQWHIMDIVGKQGNFPAEAILDNEISEVENNIDRALHDLLDREAEQTKSPSNIVSIKRLADLRATYGRLSRANIHFLHDPDPLTEVEIRERKKEIDRLMILLVSDNSFSPAQHKLLNWLSGEFRFYFELIAKGITIRKSDQWNIARNMLTHKVIPLTQEIDSLIETLMLRTAEKIRQSSKELLSLLESNFLLSGLLLSIMLLSVFFSARYLAQKIVAPIENLLGATLRLGEEQKMVAMQASGNDELGLLASAFNKMQSALIRKQEELRHLATIDSLTKLANRNMFSEAIERDWKRCLRDKGEISVIMIDVDYFKLFNDQYGHQAGDNALLEVANIIRQCLNRSSDLAARYGGEEFLIVLPNTDITGANRVALKIVATLNERKIPSAGGTRYPFLSVSCGVSACRPASQTGWEDLIKAADAALDRAKSNGRNQVCESTCHILSSREVGVSI